MIGILKYSFLHVREVQQILRVWVGDDRDINILLSSCQGCPQIFKVWDDMDIKVLFCSYQGGPTNIQGVFGG